MAVAAAKQEDKLIQFPGSPVKVVVHKSHKQMKTNSFTKKMVYVRRPPLIRFVQKKNSRRW